MEGDRRTSLNCLKDIDQSDKSDQEESKYNINFSRQQRSTSDKDNKQIQFNQESHAKRSGNKRNSDLADVIKLGKCSRGVPHPSSWKPQTDKKEVAALKKVAA